MPEVLSQGEIDALLSAITSGELRAEEIRRDDEAARVRVYDFKRAMRFSKDHIRTISRVYEQYSRLMATYFSAQLRTVVQVSLGSVEQVPFEEFVRSVPPSTVLHVVDVEPLGGKFVLEVASPVSLAMLDRLLGGQGDVPDANRRLTEIDTAILEQFFSRSLPTLSTAWAGIAELQFRYDTLEVNPQFLQIASPNDVVLVVSFAVTVAGVAGMVNICMPHVVLESLLPRLNARYVLAMPGRAGQDRHEQTRILARHMDAVEVLVHAELGRTELRVDEVMSLGKGDVIPLEQPVGSLLALRVGEAVKYLAQPGTHRGRYAVRIAQAVEEGENDE